MLKIGLTGGIACGKSKALSCFRDLGAHTIDADLVAREVVKPGRPALREIVQEFGREFLHEDGTLNRSALADLVFSDEAARTALNRIIHPYIIDEESAQLSALEERETADSPCLAVVDAPLMIEVGTYCYYDAVVVVYCPQRIQLERLTSRGSLSPEQALSRIASQMPGLEKIRYADYVVNSAGPVEETRGQIRFIYRELLIRWEEGSLGSGREVSHLPDGRRFSK